MTRYVAVADQSEMDQKWMREALEMARQAFEAAEVPVGSVFVRNGQVIARARNRTNELMNVSDLSSRIYSSSTFFTNGIPNRQRGMLNWKPLIIYYLAIHQRRRPFHSHHTIAHLVIIPLQRRLYM